MLLLELRNQCVNSATCSAIPDTSRRGRFAFLAASSSSSSSTDALHLGHVIRKVGIDQFNGFVLLQYQKLYYKTNQQAKMNLDLDKLNGM